MVKKCLFCGKKITRKSWEVGKKWGRRNFCNQNCCATFRHQNGWGWLGKHHSLKTRRKMSVSCTGRKATPEAINHMRAAQKKYFKTHPGTMLGKHLSKEAKEKVSLANSGKNSAWYGRKMTREEVRKRLHRRKMSGVETRVNNTIKKYHLPYRFVGNGDFFIERKNPDFVNVNGQKIAIEVYWKEHKDLFRGGADRWREDRKKLFAKYGWSIIFIEASKMNEDIILKAIGGGESGDI